MAIGFCGVVGRRHPVEDSFGQLDHRAGPHDAGFDHTVGFLSDELGLTLPAGRDGLGDEHGSLDDEATFVVTRTAAPDQAPQLLYSWIVERQRTHCTPVCLMTRWQAPTSPLQSSAALAASTSEPNAAGSVIARSERILRSTSMPAAFSPAMNRL